MPLPSSHKIVVIDDKPEEVASLIGTLSKNGIGVVYFTGQLEQLPIEPLSGIRIIFSDIDLVESKDNKTKQSALLAVLQKVISPDNGPYIIVFWTKHSDFIDDIKTEWDKLGYPPLKYLCIEKSSCKDEKGEFSISMIDQHIKEKVDTFQAFNFYLEWENILLQQGEKFVSKFHKLIPQDVNWSHNIYYLLYRLFHANTDKNSDTYKNEEQFIIACSIFNKSFNSELDRGIFQLSIPSQLPANALGSLSTSDIASAINNFLWLHNVAVTPVVLGDVFIASNDDYKEQILRQLTKESELANIDKNEICLVKMVVTPSCDIAQCKLLKNKNGHSLHRTVYGVIMPSSIRTDKSNAAWCYKFGPFCIGEKENLCMYLHFGTVGAEYIIKGETNPHYFTIKQEIAFDIQSKIANHMNRLGNSLLA